MMKIVRMVLAGIALIFLVFIAEMLVTLPFSLPSSEDPAIIRQYLVWEFLLTALPAVVLTFLAALVLKLKRRKDAWLHAIIWTGMYLLAMVLVAIGNQGFAPIFGNFAFYVLVVLYFLGPLIYIRIKKLPA